jgi:hypothetical protein
VLRDDFSERINRVIRGFTVLLQSAHRLPKRKLEDNIKVDFQKVGGGCGDWLELAQDRDRWRALVSTVKNLRVPYKCGEFLD